MSQRIRKERMFSGNIKKDPNEFKEKYTEVAENY